MEGGPIQVHFRRNHQDNSDPTIPFLAIPGLPQCGDEQQGKEGMAAKGSGGNQACLIPSVPLSSRFAFLAVTAFAFK